MDSILYNQGKPMLIGIFILICIGSYGCSGSHFVSKTYDDVQSSEGNQHDEQQIISGSSEKKEECYHKIEECYHKIAQKYHNKFGLFDHYQYCIEKYATSSQKDEVDCKKSCKMCK